MQAARQENEDLHKALDQCKEKIFELQPKTQVSDAEIGEQLDRLCDSIRDWIDSDLDRDNFFLHNLDKITGPTRISEALTGVLPGGELEYLDVYPLSQAAFAEVTIHRFLQSRLLSLGDHFAGLENGEELLLKQIGDGIRLANVGDRSTGNKMKQLFVAILTPKRSEGTGEVES